MSIAFTSYLPAVSLSKRHIRASDAALIHAELSKFLKASRRRFVTVSRFEPLYDRAAEFVLRGGKRIRPLLALASYRILSGQMEQVPRAVARASASLELFHAFMLVHDDLIDASASRRDQPTLPEAIRRDTRFRADSRRAADLGIVAGDLLFALGNRLVGRSGLDPRMTARVQRLLADVLVETGAGQALDVLADTEDPAELTAEAILEMYRLKTARYSISGPMLLGATLAGAPSAVRRALSRLGDQLGLAYQLRNDLDALDGLDDECSDLDSGKRTLLLWTAHQRLDPLHRAKLAEALTLPVGPPRRYVLRQLFHLSGAIAAIRARLEAFHEEATVQLDAAPLPSEHREAFRDLLDGFDLNGSHQVPRPEDADASD